jgi:FdhD protein
MDDALRASRLQRGWAMLSGSLSALEHEVVVEEPLEIRVAGENLALTMRTPGEDRQLALGFLYAEGMVHRLDDVGSVYHCGRTDDPAYGNAIEVTPGPGVSLDLDLLQRVRRRGVTSSACGLCGRDSIEDLLARTPRVSGDERFEPELLARAPALLARGQLNFARTGGLHAACALTPQGEVLACAEDVGRHNAVDKVIGKLLYQQALPAQTTQRPRACLLAVSGRASCEIVQKAAMAGFLGVASVSATTSLAIDTAEALGVTLASFVREGRFTLYTHPARVRGFTPV